MRVPGAWIPVSKKPRLYLDGGMWYCIGLKPAGWIFGGDRPVTAAGITPAFAYELWMDI